MTMIRKIILMVSLFAIFKGSSSEESSSREDLQVAEANGKLEIVKQIKKVNDDGSYTIGYEADDGSFKIESRDVLGNIKGTYGYIDENGDIKRVSYTSNNSSEVKSESSVVQRIPKLNKTSTTRRPVYIPTVPTTVVQSIPKRRTTSTEMPNTEKYGDFIKAAVEASKNLKPNLYENQSPRILLQRPLLRSDSQKSSEGQIVRPDTNVPPTEPPLFRRIPTLLDKEKPIAEEDDTLKNNLRRQLQPQNGFNPKDFQQNRGGDMVDVYSSSLTTGTPRPLFTTTRPKYISSTIPPVKYQYQEATTTQTPTVVQIPASKEDTLVAIAQPNGRTILVPLREIPEIEADNFYVKRYHAISQSVPIHQNINQNINPNINQNINPNIQENIHQPIREPVHQHQPEQKFKAIPVRVDGNGYIRQTPQYYNQLNYEINKINNVDEYINNEEEINSIRPPVSTKDFQKLLEQLILRQSRLEQISYLSRKYENMFGLRTKPVYKQYRENNLEYYNNYVTPESFTPTRRVARLLSPQQQKDEESDYLPPDVREMLLLRMLQLAINPGLPLNVPDNFVDATTSYPKMRKSGVRNVEILGEEDETKIGNR